MIKICGLTNREDLSKVATLAPDAIGFVLAKSPRKVSIEELPALTSMVPPGVSSFGVFVNPDEELVLKAIMVGGIDVVQLHGDEDPDFCKRFSPRVVKALRLRSEEDLERIKPYEGCVRGFLIDAWVEDQYGGTGRRVDLTLAARAIGMTERPVILAGGLSPENLEEVLKEVRPYGVDVSSGVERSPGKKDLSLCKRFVNIARSLGL